jgi:hypothetical protein
MLWKILKRIRGLSLKIRGLSYFHKIKNVVKDTCVYPELKRGAFFICALLENEFYELNSSEFPVALQNLQCSIHVTFVSETYIGFFPASLAAVSTMMAGRKCRNTAHTLCKILCL